MSTVLSHPHSFAALLATVLVHSPDAATLDRSDDDASLLSWDHSLEVQITQHKAFDAPDKRAIEIVVCSLNALTGDTDAVYLQ